MIDTSAILRESVEAVCPACPNRGLCWEKHKQKTNEAISHTYRRMEESQRERFFSPEVIEKAFSQNGFSLVAAYGSLNQTAPTATDEKCYYVVKRD